MIALWNEIVRLVSEHPVAQGLGLVALVVTCLSYQARTTRGIALRQAVGSLFWTTHLLLLGAWFAASLDFPSQIRADRTIEARHGVLPGMRYEFHPDRVVLTGEGSMTIPYGKFTRLMQDRDYLYLFISRDSVCMLERASLKPQPPETFMRFIEEKTGLNWRREFSYFSLNLADILQILRDRGKK